MISRSTPKSSYLPSKGRSRYLHWTMRDGTKMRLEDMTDLHLRNSIALLERKAQEHYPEIISAGYSALSFVQGEMATMDIENGLDALEEDGWEGVLPSTYYDMVDELARREREGRS